jgi:hypothetical protein
MNASRIRSWACIGLGALLFGASACVAETGSSDGEGQESQSNVTQVGKAAGTAEDLAATATAGSAGSGRGVPPGFPGGPPLSPVPSPWESSPGEANPGDPGGNDVGAGAAPVPSPWMSPSESTEATDESTQPAQTTPRQKTGTE